MLNTFPDLLAYGLLAPFLLRITLGLVFVRFGWHKCGRGRVEKAAFFDSLGWKPGASVAMGLGALELAVGALLIVGIYTQLAALAAAVVLLGALILKKQSPQGIASSRGFLALLFIIALSLIVSGAGFFAFDVPL